MTESSGQPHSLELFQRDAFGLIDDPMDFDEMTLGKALRITINNLNLDRRKSIGLLAIADALDNEHAEWRLRLVASKPGARRLHHHNVARDQMESDVFVFLETETLRLGKREAAIISTRAMFGIARSEVFRMAKSARERNAWLHELFTSLGWPKKSPSKDGN